MPLPEAKTLDELNSKLLEGCREDEARTVAGRAQTVGEGMLIERERLLGLAAEGFEIEVSSFPKVDATGCVKVRTKVVASRDMSAATLGSRRSLIWSITSTYWPTSRERWRARRRWNNGAKPGVGRRATTRYGRS